MIVKEIEFQSRQPGQFKTLVNYLINPQGKEHRVGQVRLTNYNTQDVKDALIETILTQSKNTRAKSSDTYHLVISFPNGEIPSEEVLRLIEQRMVDSLGYGEHQRMSVTHHDTDHFHLHLAINKVHPQTNNLVTPYQSWNALGKCCLECERDYKLTHDNHVVQRVLYVDGEAITEDYIPNDSYIRNQKARDMDYQLETTSLTRYLKDEVKDQVLKAKSWSEVHEFLSSKGVVIKLQGRGFVFKSAHSEISVKASSVARELSFERMVKRFGTFVSADVKPEENPQPRPPSPLYLRYEREKEEWKEAKNAQYVQLSEHTRVGRQDAYSRYRLAVMKSSSIKDPIARTLFLVAAKTSLQKELSEISKQRKERAEQLKLQRPMSWATWLQKKASEGDVEALIALRKKDVRLRIAYKVQSLEPSKLFIDGIEIDSVTKQGTIIYRCGDTTLRDVGQSLVFPNDYERDSMAQALKAAKDKYQESPLVVTGSEEFKNDLLIVAASMNEKFSFQDPALQSTYEKLKIIEVEDAKKRYKRRLQKNTGRNNGGARAGRSGIESADGGIGSRRGESNESGREIWRRSVSGYEGDGDRNLPKDMAGLPIEALTKLLLKGSIDQVPGNDLFEMSIWDVASEKRHSDLQMPGTLRRHLQQSETSASSSVRSIHRLDERSRCEFEAIKQFVDKRNQKRNFIEGILLHKPFEESAKEERFVFKGIRHVDGISLVLLQQDNEIFVKAISNAQVKHFKELAVGTGLVHQNGQLSEEKQPRVSR